MPNPRVLATHHERSGDDTSRPNPEQTPRPSRVAEAMPDAIFIHGYVGVKLSHFCDIVPEWPAAHASGAVAFLPFYHTTSA